MYKYRVVLEYKYPVTGVLDPILEWRTKDAMWNAINNTLSENNSSLLSDEWEFWWAWEGVWPYRHARVTFVVDTPNPILAGGGTTILIAPALIYAIITAIGAIVTWLVIALVVWKVSEVVVLSPPIQWAILIGVLGFAFTPIILAFLEKRK